MEADSDSVRLARLYDRLSRWARFRNRLAPGSRSHSLSMHKVLIPSVDDLAFEAARLPPEPHVLDAGCGLGGTVFRWYEKAGGTYEGITLSPVQADMATVEARRRGISSSCRFRCRSYDEPLAGSYDAVVAIESLIHSRDFSRTVGHLSRLLKPGGRLVMVDDVLADDGDSASGSGLNLLKSSWHLTAVPSEKTVRMAFALSSLTLVQETDLTRKIRWVKPRLVLLIVGFLRAFQHLAPVRWMGEVERAYRGGVVLQRMYQEGKTRYKLFVGEKGNR